MVNGLITTKTVRKNMRNTIDGECISRVSSYNILKMKI